MLTSTIEKKLNEQVELEGFSSQYYLAMASWAENNGLNGVSNFLYRQSDEERLHMLKLVKYINERGGKALITALQEPAREFDSLPNVFEQVHSHEVMVSTEINKLVEACLQEKDYTTHNFLQWYVAEQIEEEALAKNILDKLKLIGNDKGGLYLFDRDLETLTGAPVAKV
ncbi:MAG: ferritin [Bacteroidota bacterium]|nr:ferritin [Bacteroidota bacterium]